MKKANKIFSLVLAFVMLFGIIPFAGTAFADDGEILIAPVPEIVIAPEPDIVIAPAETIKLGSSRFIIDANGFTAVETEFAENQVGHFKKEDSSTVLDVFEYVNDEEKLTLKEFVDIDAGGPVVYTFNSNGVVIVVYSESVEKDGEKYGIFNNAAKDGNTIIKFVLTRDINEKNENDFEIIESVKLDGAEPYINRAMVVHSLWERAGEPVVNYAMSFKDVEEGEWYTEAIRWAAAEGIVSGYTADTFAPEKAVSNAEIVTIFWRFAKAQGYDVSVGEDTNILSYDDAFDVYKYAIPAFQWACGAGVYQAEGTALNYAEKVTSAQFIKLYANFTASYPVEE